MENLKVQVFGDRKSLGLEAAQLVGNKIKKLLNNKDEINIIFAAAPSQNEFLEEFVKDDTIPWESINAFHMDEYLGLPDGALQTFGHFLTSRLFDKRPFKSVNLLNGAAQDFNEECVRYAKLLLKFPADIVCLGIGENTHIAFNDPGQADFNDRELVKVVQLDTACRQQQVNDKCFRQISDVPEFAITLTIPALTSAQFISCVVPGRLKATAVCHTLRQPVSAAYPSTILREKHGAVLLLDKDGFSAYNS
ncbi:6-phosphogluconolactonase [Mucilaginibacter sp.]|uniref:6-phosphogluconolactonase n=1 Tax=Mucilaginibacter sp. TaxID=1882438 RepID=UPI0025FC61A0|nr:6-phosphogluconolactonase [Mucilaginibacter sp.]